MGCSSSTNNSTANTNGGANNNSAVRLKTTQTGPKINQLNLNSAKVVLLGESAVGKSSICERFVSSNFQTDNATTIGAAFLHRPATLKDGTSIKWNIWDTGGQERFRALAPLYYRDASGALIVFDITRRETFEKVKSWLDELDSKESVPLVRFLVGSKKDLESQREVTQNEARTFAQSHNCNYFEVSSKSGENVLEMFESLGQELISEAKKKGVLVQAK